MLGLFHFRGVYSLGGEGLRACYLYVLYSPTIDQYYIGISHDVEERLHYHNSSYKGWTRRGRPWHVVFSRLFESKKQAKVWEKWLKSQKDRRIIEKVVFGSFDWKE